MLCSEQCVVDAENDVVTVCDGSQDSRYNRSYETVPHQGQASIFVQIIVQLVCAFLHSGQIAELVASPPQGASHHPRPPNDHPEVL